MRKDVGLYFILLIVFCGLTSCKQDFKINDSKISFPVDSFKIINIPVSFGTNFIFSPIDNQDYIWILGSKNGAELNLKSGKIRSLTEVFGFKYNGGIIISSIWRDSLNHDIYIDVAYEKLIRYDAKSKLYQRVNISGVNGMVSTNDNIYFSNHKGLFTFERTKGELKHTYTNFLREDINSISKVNERQILIKLDQGDDVTYDLVDGTTTSYKKLSYNPLLSNDKSEHPIFQILPKEILNAKIIKDDSLIWLFNSNKLLFSYDDVRVYECNLPLNSRIYDIDYDKDHLYIHFKDKMGVYKKDYLLKHSSLSFKGNPNAQRKDLDFIKAELSTTLELDTFIHFMRELNSESTFRDYDNINQLMDYFKYRLRILQHNSNFRKQTESYIENGTFPTEYLNVALEGLINFYVRNEKFGQTKKYIEMYQKNLSKENNYIYTYMCYLGTIKSLDSLGMLSLSPDEILYQSALLKEKLINCGGFGESYIDNTIVVDSYKKLLKQYPTSEFTDDAAYYLATSYEYEDMGFSEESINELREFIKKYPNSDKVVDAELLIIEIYMRYSETPDQMMVMYSKTAKEIKKLEEKYTLSSSQSMILNNIKSNLNQYIIKTKYEFKVEPQKKEYLSGEDIIIDVTLTNKLSKKVELQIFKNISPFNISVTLEGKVYFVNSSKTDDERTTLFLQGNETKFWKLNLTKEARSVAYPRHIGKYDFSKSGSYYISLYGINKNLNSNQSKLIIK